jgi:hypothetical protein
MRMMKIRYLFYVAIMVVISCDDIIEKDIADDTMVLHAPSNGYKGHQGKHTFWWDEVNGASKYRLTIASPYVDSADFVVLDTIITKNKFEATMPAGNIQWCVKAMNGYYETKYGCNSIVLDSVLVEETDISADKIVLQSPSDKHTTNLTDQIFWWEKLDGVTQYHLIVASPDVSNATTIIADTVITKNTFEMTMPVGKAQWCVQGENTQYKTTYTCRSLEITE